MKAFNELSVVRAYVWARRGSVVGLVGAVITGAPAARRGLRNQRLLGSSSGGAHT